MRIWTIGHSTRSIDDFISLLEENGIKLVADVRMFPGSKRYPQFGREALDVTGTDLHTGQVQGEGSVRGGVQPCGRLRDLLQHRRTVVMVIQAQGGPQGGKSPGGSRDSGTPARVR